MTGYSGRLKRRKPYNTMKSKQLDFRANGVAPDAHVGLSVVAVSMSRVGHSTSITGVLVEGGAPQEMMWDIYSSDRYKSPLLSEYLFDFNEFLNRPCVAGIV